MAHINIPMASKSINAYSLYRMYLRQVRTLPHLYLRQFFKIKARDDVQGLLYTTNDRQRRRRMVVVVKSISQIEKANKGRQKAFDRILDIAYGRKGKLRWELMEPFTLGSNSLLTQPTTPAVQEESRHPVYSPALKALLTSPHSRTTKALNSAHISQPPVLPARADPTSSEAHIFGTLSKRRETNIRWRYFRSECRKVNPPIEVHSESVISKSGIEPHCQPLERSMQQFGFGGQELFADIERLVGELHRPTSYTRRERQKASSSVQENVATRHPSRWLRRRYQSLLTRLPLLVQQSSENSKKSPSPGVFAVQRSNLALPAPYQRTVSYMPEAGTDTVAWLESTTTSHKVRPAKVPNNISERIST
ncbi:hypothetical protein B0H34DRAFT_27751 [Crassisporium funariophilum]|nr:hypothetical protein B0H34DRAFT_27751 [Crassisporium funariophilum]